MTEVCRNELDVAFGTMVASEFAAMTLDGNQAWVKTFDQTLASICPVCPDFLVPTVLEGMLRELTEQCTQDDLVQVVSSLVASSTGKHDGYILGLKTLKCIAKEGVAQFFPRLAAMSLDEIKDFRRVGLDQV